MPKGVPVGTLAIGSSGAMNAGLLAIAMLATTDASLQEKLVAWRAARRDEVLAQKIGEDEASA
jgi:5-(carboxyamino)imidazole ribonucleotide mutase